MAVDEWRDQAVEDRIIKAPIIVTKEDDPKQQTGKPWKFFRINQVGFETLEPKTLIEIVKGSEPREGKLFQ